jgi:hypothetical protein
MKTRLSNCAALPKKLPQYLKLQPFKANIAERKDPSASPFVG